MRVLFYILLVINVFLVIVSGLSKMALMPKEVAFFGEFGFSDPLLMGFGLVQCLAGIAMIFRKPRLLGLALAALTFLVSAVVLFVASNILMALLTLGFIVILGWLARFHQKKLPNPYQNQAQ